ncbi:hypothetical protein J5N97_023177 [Dioscorea zingiberensis]|uniref:Uncharacterized protein n=1 Tax=Dioscorea zingiberensis TaxID=325984 RepID=A0A9D5CDL0_9LILI|nr:hypothetical protein J5N97_023177 [Dioscorea zingiberensis]
MVCLQWLDVDFMDMKSNHKGFIRMKLSHHNGFMEKASSRRPHQDERKASSSRERARLHHESFIDESSMEAWLHGQENKSKTSRELLGRHEELERSFNVLADVVADEDVVDLLNIADGGDNADFDLFFSERVSGKADSEAGKGLSGGFLLDDDDLLGEVRVDDGF